MDHGAYFIISFSSNKCYIPSLYVFISDILLSYFIKKLYFFIHLTLKELHYKIFFFNNFKWVKKYVYLYNLSQNICHVCKFIAHFSSNTLKTATDAIITLTFTALKYFCINHGNQRVFQFEIIINVLVSSFPLHLNTCVMGLRPL